MYAQDYKIGLKLIPVTFNKNIDYTQTYNNNQVGNQFQKCQTDSFNVNVQAEKSFKSNALVLRCTFSYGQYNVISKDIEEVENQPFIYHFSYYLKQDYLSISPGIGNKIDFKPFSFQLGVEVPCNFMINGKLDRLEIWGNDNENKTVRDGHASFSDAYMIGLGGFANLSTVLFKKISLGFDISYAILFCHENIKWNSTVLDYSAGVPDAHTLSERISSREVRTTRVYPSLIISYCF